jgi:hypothetical protein
MAGFLMTLVPLVRVAMYWAREFLLPDDPALYLCAIAGIAVVGIAWIWSLFTSLAQFRRGV